MRDLSIVVADALPAEIIRGTIQAAGARSGGAARRRSRFFDRYQGKGVPDGSVSLSVRLTFQAADRTLTDAEVQHSFDTILAALVREHGAMQTIAPDVQRGDIRVMAKDMATRRKRRSSNRSIGSKKK